MAEEDRISKELNRADPPPGWQPPAGESDLESRVASLEGQMQTVKNALKLAEEMFADLNSRVPRRPGI